ncbi:MAG: hypothetical protein HYY76_00390 [Acidobacteria bacterium]|nr:hypothetical protein [Acidobacteriota bacterium]
MNAVGSLWQPDIHGVDSVPLSHPLLDEDVDAVLERMADLAGENRRRTGHPRERSSPHPELSARDHRLHAPPRIDLILYTSAVSEKSQRALRAVKEVLKEYEPGQVNFSTSDLSVRPQDAEADSVVFTPTLVKHGPGPRTAIIGNLKAPHSCAAPSVCSVSSD